MRGVAIVGVGHAKFGRRTDATLGELAWEAVKEALDDARLDQKDIQYFVVGNAGGWSAEPLPAVVIGEYCGLTPKGAMRVEAACASGSAALYNAYLAVASGMADIAMAIGVEKMYESPTPTVVEFIGRAGNYFWEFENFGLTFPGYYALYMTAYMNRFGATEEDFCKVAVKNHYYGSMNPKAQFYGLRITVDQCLKSRYVAWPIKLYDSSPITDGAAAVILASEELARKITDTPVWIRSIGVATGTANLSKRPDFIGLDAAYQAAEQAFRRVGIEHRDTWKYFDVADVHDCFTIAEVMAYEDLGFTERGTGIQLIREGQTYKGGLIPVNLDGGLKAKGHPIGATGVSMAVEMTKQLRQSVEPRDRQADVYVGWALSHNVGGTGHYAYITLYSLDKDGSPKVKPKR
ncbi:MAG: thiolase domain-containing protein [Vulcanisaeta sp.]|jgi:acetyl-CoA C-acetyltransferase|nr:thiolase domain-containing protein [Vulcanisaeta sp.]MCG2870147.1 thiolase domain-containing protein [Vulcanisaeta sp.]MCG2879776.1 thiolase domain-containing protein [Vulcanisaeta sp.]MCG2886430.1 thiolase domain-containing protein [Vulcanisaeta sp.]MCG2892111.1 thiolase domain-containing protein [Vulcanisaeta sp.]